MTIEDRHLELASAIADGRQVDWDAEKSAANSRKARRLVAAWRDLAGIAEAHRILHAETDPTPRQWGHLETIAKIGEGSFGEVFRARDTRLDREVALKLLSSLPTVEGDDVVLREARLLARIKHPNVATVYGADRLHGRVGLWMELLEGRTLAQLVAGQGPFGARETAVLGIDLCRAVAAVHAEGIVHRDIKAQNVVRERGGRIVLMDFGIGQEMRPDGTDEHELSGTPLYLAPELFTGGRATVRSDVYSLGVLLFHLVSGRFPVEGRSLADLRRAHRRGEVQLLRDLRPDLPQDFLRVVERASAADPARRFASAGELEKALAEALGGTRRRSWWRWAAVAAALVIGVSIWMRPQPKAAPTRVLVAGWTNDTEEPRFNDAFRESLNKALRRTPSLEAVTHEAYDETLSLVGDRRFPERRSELDRDQAAEIARRNNAVALVEGAVHRIDRGFEVTFKLVRTSTREELEALRLSVADDEVRPAIDELAEQAAETLAAMGLTLPEQDRLERVTTHSFEALVLYSSAVRFNAGSDLEKARRSLEAALDLDPDFAMAHRLLASTLSGMGQFQEALDASLKAYKLRASTTPRERMKIEGTYFQDRAQYQEAIDAFRLSVDTGEATPHTLRQLAMAYAELGDFDEGIDWARTARDENPSDVVNQGVLVLQLAETGRVQDALKELKKARLELSDQPEDRLLYLGWGEGLARLINGEIELARDAFRAMGGGEGLAGYSRLMVAQTHLCAGEPEPAHRLLEDDVWIDKMRGDHFTLAHAHHWLARIDVRLGRREEALRHLEYFDRLMNSPAHVRHLRNAALVYVELGELRQARRLYEAIKLLAAEYPSLFSHMARDQVAGMLALEEGRLDAARELLESVPLLDGRVLASRVRLYEALGDTGRGRDACDRLMVRKGQILRHDVALLLAEANCRP